MEDMIYSTHTCVCGKQFDWHFLLESNNSIYIGNPQHWINNVIDFTLCSNKYVVTVQCPYCNRREILTYSE